jgi:hypothetical protein
VALGGRARFAQPRRRFTSRFGKGVCVVTDEGLEIDVHRSFVAGPFGLAIVPDDMFQDEDTIILAGVKVPVLTRELNFLHACYHAALGNRAPRYATLRDLAVLLSGPALDVDHILALATRWHGRAVVQRSLHLVRHRLPVPLRGSLMDWSDEYRPDQFERAALTAYVSPGANYAAQAVAGLSAIRGFRQKAAYAGALLFPTRSYLRDRDRSYGERWRRALDLQRRRVQAR